MRLINEGVYFNCPDPARDEALPIHTACKAGNQAMVDTLMQMGAYLRYSFSTQINVSCHRQR